MLLPSPPESILESENRNCNISAISYDYDRLNNEMRRLFKVIQIIVAKTSKMGHRHSNENKSRSNFKNKKEVRLDDLKTILGGRRLWPLRTL